MTREILFRGKRTDNGEWIEGYYAKQSNHACFEYELKYTHFIYKDVFMDFGLGGLCEAEVIPETVGQYTGRTDKNGKKIFEGDIATCMTKYGGDIGIVTFKDGKFAIYWQSEYRYPKCGKTTDYYHMNARTKVVGNIYDNPELIGEKTND